MWRPGIRKIIHRNDPAAFGATLLYNRRPPTVFICRETTPDASVHIGVSSMDNSIKANAVYVWDFLGP